MSEEPITYCDYFATSVREGKVSFWVVVMADYDADGGLIHSQAIKKFGKSYDRAKAYADKLNETDEAHISRRAKAVRP